MELTHRFSVPTDVDTAWTAFNDLEDIAPCFPGARLTDYDGTHLQGLVRVKLGPISLQYTGSGEFVERDESAHRAVIDAKGRDKRGNGTAAAKVTLTLTPDGTDRTDVEVLTDLNVTGKPAQFGRGVMQDVSDRLLAQFVACLEQKFDGSGPTDVGDETPIATAAAAAAANRTDSAGGADGEGSAASGTATPAGDRTSGPGARETGSDGTELDLGSAVLPVVLKRYAPYALGALVLFVVLRALFGGSDDEDADDADVIIEVVD